MSGEAEVPAGDLSGEAEVPAGDLSGEAEVPAGVVVSAGEVVPAGDVVSPAGELVPPPLLPPWQAARVVIKPTKSPMISFDLTVNILTI